MVSLILFLSQPSNFTNAIVPDHMHKPAVPRYIIPCQIIPSFLGPPTPGTSLKTKGRVSHLNKITGKIKRSAEKYPSALPCESGRDGDSSRTE